MLKHRLPLGIAIIVVMLLLAWLDEALEGALIPAALAPLSLTGRTLPTGLTLFFILAFANFLAAGELATIFRANHIKASTWLTRFAALAGLLTSVAIPLSFEAGRTVAIVASAIVLVLLLSMVHTVRHETVEGVVAAAGGTLFAFVYLGMLFGFLLLIRRGHSIWVILGVVLITKSCDIGAYFTGRAIGRRKLVLWLSPGKTWEGLAGGLIFSTLIGLLLSMMSDRAGAIVTWWQGALAGLIFGLLGQAGDLVASLLKRDAGLKDASKTLPGFGGVLDVVDSPLLVAPAAYWMLVVFARINGG